MNSGWQPITLLTMRVNRKRFSSPPVSSDIGDLRYSPDFDRPDLQENILASSGGLSKLLHIPGAWRVRSRHELLSNGPAVHQLASLQPDALHHRAGEPTVGGNSGCALSMVGLSADSNDRLLYCGVGWTPDRRSLPLGCGQLRNGDCL